jgi:hypothetical protein
MFSCGSEVFCVSGSGFTAGVSFFFSVSSWYVIRNNFSYIIKVSIFIPLRQVLYLQTITKISRSENFPGILKIRLKLIKVKAPYMKVLKTMNSR